MFTSKVLTRCLIPAAAAAVESRSQGNKDENLRPSELPIYTADPVSSVCDSNDEKVPGILESSVKSVRVSVTKFAEEYKAFQRVAVDEFEKGKEQFDSLIDYLREEDNTLPKAGAIGIGAFAGLIFGLRGGFFKKTLYASTGALGMAAVCYPKEAAEYTEEATVQGKKYLTIAYNFMYGVKKDEPPLELPKLPSSAYDTWDLLKNTATSFISDKTDESKSATK